MIGVIWGFIHSLVNGFWAKLVHLLPRHALMGEDLGFAVQFSHVNKIGNKISQTIGVIIKLKHLIPQKNTIDHLQFSHSSTY